MELSAVISAVCAVLTIVGAAFSWWHSNVSKKARDAAEKADANATRQRECDTATRSHREDRRSAQPSARRARLLRRMAKQRHLRVTQHRDRPRYSQRNHQRHRGTFCGRIPVHAQPRLQPTHL